MGIFGNNKSEQPTQTPIVRQITQTEKSVDNFILDLSSRDPVPGGGGASAVAGAIGTALGGMVASLTIGKDKYKDVESEITALKTRAYTIQKELLALVQMDAEVFSKLAAVYRMPKENEEERKNKERLMESALRDAADVPLTIMKKCCEAIVLCDGFAQKGNAMAISDAGCGVIILKSALQSAWLNVLINTKSMKNREYAKKLNEEGMALLKEHLIFADRIYEDVENQLR